ncbi:hypothetical protein Cfor_05787 [Coptotermes formosanus]|uniref:Uncharacterized protein n=1 Tax=Coptotermes formosanus TaxID=36987 RepID=A0A6L2PX63_COPFO|nr:hypothetical protein Cfor_05787 [Coptotermes formosanus]
MRTVITGDESWVCGYDPETRAQSSQWKAPGSPRPKKARQVRRKVKVMLTIFFDHEGVVHDDYALERQTGNQEYYVDVLRRLRDAVRRKRPASWQRGEEVSRHGGDKTKCDDGAVGYSKEPVRQWKDRYNKCVVSEEDYFRTATP